MAKKTFPVATTSDYLSTFNQNFADVAQILQDQVAYRNNPPDETNTITNDWDMDGNRVFNLPAPIDPSEAARLQDVIDATTGIVPASVIPFSPSGTIISTNVQAAIQELDSDTQAQFAVINAAWQPYTPVLSASGGTIVDSTTLGRYKQIGKNIIFNLSISIVDNGDGSEALLVTLPVLPVFNVVGNGKAYSVSNKSVTGISIISPTLIVTNYDGTYPGSSGEVIIISGQYEVA